MVVVCFLLHLYVSVSLQWFHEEVSKSEEDMPDDVLNGLFNLFDPLNAAHSQFLRDLEQRLATWEGKSTILHKREIQKVGDIILMHFNILPVRFFLLSKEFSIDDSILSVILY